ncbi:MFS general substrate transporter [Phlegmacium glaucopus]|nr:MFS general substrate transporter [Phlegmacium glaucopus]
MTDVTAVDVASGTKDVLSSTSSTKSEKSSHKVSEHTVGTLVRPGHGESTMSEDKKEEFLKTLEDDWETDPDNARNWPAYQRWIAVSIVSFYTFMPPLASSMMAPGLPDVGLIYHIDSPTVIALTLSAFLISFALGPLILAPLSEMYGRTWVLHIANIFTLVFSLGCAYSPTTGSLIAFRFLAGFSGSAPIAIGGGSVSDLFAEKDRASAMALYTVGPLFGPALGPVAGGFITEKLGIKWVFIVIAVTSGVASIVGIPFLKETYAPIIRMRRAARLADPEVAAREHSALILSRERKIHVLWVNLTRPLVILFRSLVCFMLSLYMAFMYGIYYLMFSTFPQTFQSIYGFNTGIGGLAYLGLGVGFLAASLFGAKFGQDMYKKLADKNGGVGKPEMRIPALCIGSLLVPVGLLWYGWSAQARLHWMMPIVGSGIYGFAMMTTFLPISLYLVDAFTYAASATAAASLFRSMLGFAFPLFGEQMFNVLGVGFGNTLLACLAILLGIPFPIWLYFKGEAIRARSDLTR